jgi:uncharacterized glyoxalase superfamily protein PhnB
MAADTMGVQPAVNGSGLALSLMFDSNDELDAAFNRLSSGGKISQAPKEEFFGYYADLTDRYGFNWILVHSRPAA